MKNTLHKRQDNQPEIADSFMRIDRSYKNILELKKRLCCYSCEPKTYSLFEQLEDIKLNLELLRLSHLKLIDTLKSPIHFIEALLQQVREQIKEACLLEHKVATYISLAKSS